MQSACNQALILLRHLMREAISMQPACNQNAISMQSACNQHAINRQSACNRHLEGQREVAVLALLPLNLVDKELGIPDEGGNRNAINMQSACNQPCGQGARRTGAAASP
jgi:hypothetical protein